MPAKAVKPVKKTIKNERIDNVRSFFKVHWLQDSSVEVPIPPSVQFEAGQRELAFTASVKQIVMPQDSDIKLEMWLRIHVHVPQFTILMSEICYSGVVDKTTAAENEKQVVEELYQHAKPQVEALLLSFGHNPPLPVSLNQ